MGTLSYECEKIVMSCNVRSTCLQNLAGTSQRAVSLKETLQTLDVASGRSFRQPCGGRDNHDTPSYRLCQTGQPCTRNLLPLQLIAKVRVRESCFETEHAYTLVTL